MGTAVVWTRSYFVILRTVIITLVFVGRVAPQFWAFILSACPEEGQAADAARAHGNAGGRRLKQKRSVRRSRPP
ncbi:hypothetical protein J3F83DRAFT_754209 [Trichoderma novae-zelandiae]